MSEEEVVTAEEATAPEGEEVETAKEEESTAHFEPVVRGRIAHSDFVYVCCNGFGQQLCCLFE